MTSCNTPKLTSKSQTITEDIEIPQETNHELEFRFKPVDLLNVESQNFYPFMDNAILGSTDTLYDEIWKLDLLPEYESMTRSSIFKWNEIAEVFTTNNHFKILDSTLNVLYEFSDHYAPIVHHLDSKPIVMVSDQTNVSFINLETFELIKRYKIDHNTEIANSITKDEFSLYFLQNDSLIIHSFNGINLKKTDTLNIASSGNGQYYSYSQIHKDLICSNYTNLLIQDINTGAKVERELERDINKMQFANNDENLIIQSGLTMLLYSYPELELLNEAPLQSYVSNVMITDKYIGYFGHDLSATLIDYEGNEIFKSNQNNVLTLGILEDHLLMGVKDGRLVNVFSMNLKNQKLEFVNNFNRSSIHLKGFLNRNKSLAFEFGSKLFYYNIEENIINEVPNYRRKKMHNLTLDPYSNRIIYNHILNPEQAFVLTLENGEESKFDYPGGYLLFTNHQDTVIGVKRDEIYKLNLKTNETKVIQTFKRKNPQTGGISLLSIKVSPHPSLNASYFCQGTILSLLNHETLKIKEYDIGGSFLGSKNDSLVYIIDNADNLVMFNLNSKTKRKLKENQLYHFIYDFYSDNDFEIAKYGISQRIIFDPVYHNRYQSMGYRDYATFSGHGFKYYASVFEDDIYFYRKRKE